MAYNSIVSAEQDTLFFLENKGLIKYTEGIEINCEDDGANLIYHSNDTMRKAGFYSLCKHHIPTRSLECSSINFNYCLANGYNARFVYYILDDEDKLIKDDTINLISSGIEEHFSCDIDVIIGRNCFFLIEGNCFFLQDINAHFGNLILNYKQRNIFPGDTESTMSICSLDDIISNHRIIAIGETIHGTKSFNTFACEYMKNAIEYDSVRLVAFELSFRKMALFDLYAQDLLSVSLENLFNDYCALIDKEILIEFVEWVRIYNRTHNSKVSLLGLEHLNSDVEIGDYINFVEAMSNTHTEYLDTLIFKGVVSERRAMEYLHENEHVFRDVFKDYNLIEQSFSYYSVTVQDEYCSPSVVKLRNRDYNMYKALEYANNRYLTNMEYKAIIYTHFGHANKFYNQTTYPVDKSLGYYLNKEYGDDYTTITLLAQKGEYLIQSISDQDSLVFRTKELKPASDGSLENHINSSDGEAYDINDTNTFVTFRKNGNFEPENLYPFQTMSSSNIDYLVIWDNTDPINYEDYPVTREIYKQYIDHKREERKAIIDKIWR